ncbi:precorrin-6A synthase (deacetylating) [Hoyosella rhizosphaerae]|nr:precorrin-6A synthase (deacetylating) [Hoyosella rhizosphaerae]MBN4925808.1 precorrin-6A synthase (deacetylating) [Hoyosella rhizosphaerae]
MRTVSVVGIGAGDPDQLTLQAIKAIQRASVFFVIDKGAQPSGLVDARIAMLETHKGAVNFTVVEIPDPPRDRTPSNYQHAVTQWHAQRADVLAAAITAHLKDGETGAFLVWGDPALYDSTLRVFELMLESGNATFEYEVIPGITSIQALTARHRIPLNRIGEPIHITTGRRLREGLPVGVTNAVVMLDAHCAFTEVADREGGEWDVWWGGNLGTVDEEIIAGRVGDVDDAITAARSRVKEQAGWIMDTYLLRRRDEPDTT